MNQRNILLSIITVIILTACASAGGPQSGNPPISLIPMYGYPEIEKSAALKRRMKTLSKQLSVQRVREKK